MNARIRHTLFASMLASLSLTATGHHSMSEYDRSAVMELEGEVSRVMWRNPHILIWIDVADENGAVATWELEASAVSAQRRRGLTGDEVQVGDEVRIAGWPSTVRPEHLQVNHVLLPDGVELLLGGVREPRWSEESLGGDRNVLDPAKVAAAEGDGLFRVWSQAVRAWYFPGRSDYQLTDYAKEAAANWDDVFDNPLMECVPPGMPGLMNNPYPMEFVQLEDGNIEMRFEEFDARRLIHMANIVDPAEVPASYMGYSVGRWEGETLVVDTSRVNWPYFDRGGAPQSEAVSINERFTATTPERLDYQMTVTEPMTLVEPFELNIHFIWRRGEEVNPYECTNAE